MYLSEKWNNTYISNRIMLAEVIGYYQFSLRFDNNGQLIIIYEYYLYISVNLLHFMYTIIDILCQFTYTEMMFQ